MRGDGVHEPHPQVVAAARRGDQRAFETLVRAYQSDIWRLCFHLLGNTSAADDATQDAFVRAYRFIHRYRGDSKFSTWLFSIARNCALDEIRRNQRRRRVTDLVEAQPEREPLRADLGIEVREAVMALPLELREPLVMIDALGQSYAEVAETVGVPVGTVKSRVHRAREAVANTLTGRPRERHGES
ncbi:MAG: sigma-70 family RNA polymerase sigma factor [Actinomycetota bacterium]|nr:sigma-70 family RNA polymerase sigma factor [Actinomycetota bacterium]